MQISAATTTTPALAGVTDLDIACAIAVVESKPPELEIHDYLDHIRQHVAPGRQDETASSIYRHLDRSSFWRAEALRAQDETEQARHEALQMRLEIDALKVKVETTKPSQPSKKRKKADSDVIPVPGSPKRARRDASPSQRGLATQASSDFQQDFGFSDSWGGGDLLMRSLYQVNRTVKTSDKTDAIALGYHLCNASSALPKVIHHAVSGVSDRLINRTENLRVVLAASSRSIALMTVGIGRLSRAQAPPESLGQAIYAYTKMYASLLDGFQQAADSETDRATANECTTQTASKAPPAKSKAKAKTIKPTNVRDNALLNMLSSFLGGIVDLFDPKLDVHRELFEGFAYCLFNSLGSRLRILTFGHARGATLFDDIEESVDCLPESDGESAQLDLAAEKSQRVAKLEAPYLIHMVRKLMGCAAAQLGSAGGAQSGKAKQASNGKGANKGALAVAARERLQRTLANSMFGTDDLEEDDPLRECLQIPVAKGTVTVPKIKVEEVEKWFEGEIWRLVGWEILAKDEQL